MSTPGTNPPSPGTNVKDPKQHTDGGMPIDPGTADVNAGVDTKLTTPPPATPSK